jgi:MFS family permease
VAGLALAAMTIGWPIAATTAGRFYLTLGFRATFLMGSAFAVAGALLLLTVNGDSSVLHLAFPCFVMGIGFGYVASPAVVAAQTAVDWSRRGVATGSNMFARSIGSAVGVAVFGAVVNSVVTSRLGGRHPAIEQVSAGVLEPAIHSVFVVTLGVAVVLVAVAALMPTRVIAPELVPTADAEPEAAAVP